jgi:hypothetical protein
MVFRGLCILTPDDGAVVPKYVVGLINYTTVFVACEFVGLVTKQV